MNLKYIYIIDFFFEIIYIIDLKLLLYINR